MPAEETIDSLTERLNSQLGLIIDYKIETDNLNDENATLRNELSNCRHEMKGLHDENAILSHKLSILEPINEDLQREDLAIKQRVIELVHENDQLKAGYPQNTKAMLDKICSLTRDHEGLARKLSKKSQELATLKKEHAKFEAEKTQFEARTAAEGTLTEATEVIRHLTEELSKSESTRVDLLNKMNELKRTLNR